MKLLGIVCSPRKNGNTEILVRECLESAHSLGADTEVIRVSEKDIAPCDGCESCQTTGKCHIEDDMQEMYQKLLETDGIIIGSPVYYWNITAQAKIFIDRTFLFKRRRPLANKVAGAIVVARSAGSSFSINALYNFFNLHSMIPARSISPRTAEELAVERGYGVVAYADKRGDIKTKEKAMAAAKALGRSAVETMQLLSRKPA